MNRSLLLAATVNLGLLLCGCSQTATTPEVEIDGHATSMQNTPDAGPNRSADDTAVLTENRLDLRDIYGESYQEDRHLFGSTPLNEDLQPGESEDASGSHETDRTGLSNTGESSGAHYLSDLDDVPTAPIVVPKRAPATASRQGFAAHAGGRRTALHVASSSQSRGAIEQASELPTEVTVELATRQQLRQWIDRFHGKVVFVDYWATWCGPCVQSFPSTVDLHQRGYPHDLRVITVSVDKPSQKASVLRFLKHQQATCVNLLAQAPRFQKVSMEFGIPGGSIPHFQLYDRQGEKRFQWTGGGREVALDIRRRALELMRETF